MATTFKYSPVRPAVWTTWAPAMGVLCVVGAHLLAAALGLYTLVPGGSGSQASGGNSGRLEIALQPSGHLSAGEHRMEFQLDSASGTWVPLDFERESMTYRGHSALPGLSSGSHALYLRTLDPTGHVRTVSVTVTVNPEARSPSVADAEPRPLADQDTPQG